MEQPTGMQSVVKALRVLEAVAERQPVGVGELSRRLGLPKSTVQRCLTTLGDAGWLRPSPETAGTWALSARALALGRQAERDLVASAQAPMRTLRDRLNETVHLAVRHEDQAVIVDKVESSHQLRVSREIGMSGPLTESSAGQAILRAIARRGGDPAAGGLPAENRCSVQRHDDGVYGLAAAVLDQQGEPVAALIVSIPEARFRGDLVPTWSRWVQEAASETELNMGVARPAARGMRAGASTSAVS